MIWEHLAAIIAAIGAIIASFFSYNQYSKNKFTDIKIEEYKKNENKKSHIRSGNCALVFSELYNILYSLNADRVYIVQPYPLGNEEMLSIQFEVKRKGIEPMKPKLHGVKISEVAKFVSKLIQNLFICISDIETIKDKYVRSLLSNNGTSYMYIKRLSDNKYNWVGSIFCEFTHEPKITEQEAHTILHEAATNIQYILPEYQEYE